MGLKKGQALRLLEFRARGVDAVMAHRSDCSGAKAADGIGARSANNSSLKAAGAGRGKVAVLTACPFVGTAVGTAEGTDLSSWWWYCMVAGHCQIIPCSPWR